MKGVSALNGSVDVRVQLDVDWECFMAEQDMEWVVKPVSWDEGAFMGNGLIGAMVYGEENAKKRHVLRFVMGRTDITASRTDKPGFPPRVPIGELDLELEGMIYHPTSMQLDLWNAELRAVLTTTRGVVHLRCITHSEQSVMAVEIETSDDERDTQFKWYAHQEVDHVLKNADGFNLNQFIPAARVKKSEVDGVAVCIQQYAAEEGCVTAWREVQTALNRRVYFITTVKGYDEDSKREAVDAVNQAAEANFDEWVDAHRQWWHRYYQQSFVSIPDGRLQSFYWIQMYKLASATRADRPLIDNQGPWLTSTPWPGVWFNMNVQMSYSPVYTANRLEIGKSLVRALNDNMESLIGNVPEEFQYDSAGLGRSCSFDLRTEVEDEVGNLSWICHNIWRQYRYSMDDNLLQNTLFPILRRSVNYYIHILEEGEDGSLHLPPTISPEYGSFMRTRVRDCHYDLALLRWSCQTLLAICERLEVADPLIGKWIDVLERLTPLPVDETGWMIGQDTPLAYGHRHFSHLLAVFPLHLIGCDRDEDSELIARSLRHWIGKEGDLRGFSLTGAASIAATLGWGNEALRCLQSLLLIIKPNTMYKEAGPVIETPLAGAESIHDMLLQSWGGTIRIFPAVPDEWREAAFHDLRAEGAFLVSAVRREGETQFIRVKSLAGEPCVIKTGWTGKVRWRTIGANGAEHIFQLEPGEDQIVVDLCKGEEAVLYQGDVMPDLRIRPVEAKQKVVRYYGGHKPWRLYGI
jgi:alpha-L-fucosidase 2